MAQNSAYNYQHLSQDDSKDVSSPSPASAEKSSSETQNMPRFSKTPAFANVVVHHSELTVPRLNPDTCAGICCPVGTIYNHEHPTSIFKHVLFAMEIVLHMMMMSVCMMFHRKEEDYFHDKDCNHHSDSDGQDANALRVIPFEEEESSYRYHGHHEHHFEDMDDMEKFANTFTDNEKMMLVSVVTVWFLWNVLTRVIFFTCYKPRSLFHRESNSYIVYRPNLVAKVLFPLSTVYYHEENQFCNLKMLVTYLFGCWYSLLCFKPSYQEKREADALRPRVHVARVYQV